MSTHDCGLHGEPSDSKKLHDEVEAMFSSAKLLVPEHDVHKAIDLLANKIQQDYEGKNPIFINIMNGGLFFTSQLCQRLDFPFQMDYLHATRYEDNEETDSVIWKAMPQIPLKGRHVILMDDILDRGITLQAVKNALIAQEPETLKVAVLSKKIHDRPIAELEAEYIGLEVPDEFVFGCGMDFKGYYRNLSAIYAAAD